VPELAALFAPPPAPEPPPPPPPVPEPAPAPRAARPARREPEPQPQAFLPEPEPQYQPEPEPEQPQQRAWVPEEDPDTTYFGDPNAQQEQEETQPQPRRGAAAPASNAAPLNELFSDLDLPEKGEEGEGSDEDPMAALGGGDEKESKPREDTRHFAKKAGVTRRNSPAKYVVFALLMIALPVAVLYVLSDALEIMPLRVDTVDPAGNPVQRSVFSGEGVGALRDKLLGNAPPAPVKPPPAPAPKPAATPEPKAEPAAPAAGNEGAAAPPPSAAQMEKVYADGEKKDVAPEVRADEPVAAPDAEEVGGPSDDEVERVVDQTQQSFRDCVDQELKRNPGFRGGKVTLTATVGASGKVKAATFSRKELNNGGSSVGTCIRDRAKAMVFSKFSGDDVDLEIPLVLSGR
ncbi:AgmX/PglI C-terminal domain-containing protein, partial [Myxococcus sp. K15C18031901]|uniref:AgmX/PglI C-terminal domain-containing protein n=1 Tax=Myxococcus dinghuensis TaxID=2906761 RepID=UPI0020A7B7B3